MKFYSNSWRNAEHLGKNSRTQPYIPHFRVHYSPCHAGAGHIETRIINSIRIIFLQIILIPKEPEVPLESYCKNTWKLLGKKPGKNHGIVYVQERVENTTTDINVLLLLWTFTGCYFALIPLNSICFPPQNLCLCVSFIRNDLSGTNERLA